MVGAGLGCVSRQALPLSQKGRKPSSRHLRCSGYFIFMVCSSGATSGTILTFTRATSLQLLKLFYFIRKRA
jgi:hypothetical protein